MTIWRVHRPPVPNAIRDVKVLAIPASDFIAGHVSLNGAVRTSM